MEKFFFGLLVILLFGFAGCVQSQTVEKAEKAVIKGEISGLEEPIQIRFFYMYKGNPKMDTVAVGKDGAFSYSIEISEPVMARLSQLMLPRDNSGKNVEVGPELVVPRGVQFIFTPGSKLHMDADVMDHASFIVEGDEQNATYRQYSEKKDKREGAYYGIAGFPTKFLLDKEGRLIDRYLGGEDLKKKLAEIFEDK